MAQRRGTEPRASASGPFAIAIILKMLQPVALANRPGLPRTLPSGKRRNAALRIRFHFSLCVNRSATVFNRLKNALTLVEIPACVLPCQSALKADPERELDLARTDRGAADHAGLPGAELRVRRAKLHRVRHIESLGADL